MMSDRICTVEGCERLWIAHRLCKLHYYRTRGRGTPAAREKRAPSICITPGCDCPTVGQSLCKRHYYGALRAGLIRPLQVQGVVPNGSCVVNGCDRKARSSKGFCKMHYERIRTSGEIGPAGPMCRPKGVGYIDPSGYRRIVVDGRIVFEHRVVMERVLRRPLSASENVHHVNGDRQDNRVSNLELWNVSQPAGQRIQDKVAWAKEILEQYEPVALA